MTRMELRPLEIGFSKALTEVAPVTCQCECWDHNLCSSQASEMDLIYQSQDTHSCASKQDAVFQLLSETKIPVPNRYRKFSHRLSTLSNKKTLKSQLDRFLSSSKKLHNDDVNRGDYCFLLSTPVECSASTNSHSYDCLWNFSCNSFPEYSSYSASETSSVASYSYYSGPNPATPSSSSCNLVNANSLDIYSNINNLKKSKSVPRLRGQFMEPVEHNHPLSKSLEEQSSFLEQAKDASSNLTACNRGGSSLSSNFYSSRLSKKTSLASLNKSRASLQHKIMSLSRNIIRRVFHKPEVHLDPSASILNLSSSHGESNLTNGLLCQNFKLFQDDWLMEDCAPDANFTLYTPLQPWEKRNVKPEIRRPRLNPNFFRVFVLEAQMRRAGKLSANTAGRAQLIYLPKPAVTFSTSPLHVEL
ncbi:Meiotically up-regulated protein PB1A10.08 [Schizosaccharomyces pombe]